MFALVALSGLLIAAVTGPSLSGWLLAAGLVAAMPLAYRFPIYLRHNTKVCIATVPPYILAATLSPPLAAACIGAGVVAGEASVRRKNGSTWVDIVTHGARLTLVGLAAAIVMHGVGGPSGIARHVVLLLAGAATFWLGDFLTLPFVLAPISGEPPLTIIRTTVREGGVVEAAQYGVGIAGALLVPPYPWTVALLGGPAVLTYLLARKEVDADTYQLLESMADSVDLRDPSTVGHSRRVAEVTRGILDELGRTGQEAALICLAGRLHDIGKVAIPDQILLKQGELTAQERQAMEEHAQRGAHILSEYPDLARIVEMVRHHHERWDGQGYPNGLDGANIPFGARVLAVADSFDALTSERSYRRAHSLAQAARVLRSGCAVQWDPAIVQAVLAHLSRQHDELHAMQPGDEPIGDIEGVPWAAWA